MESVEKYQKQLLEQTQYIYYETPISAATQRAYLETPRHLFIKRYRVWVTKEWCEINKDNLEEHLATLYANEPLALFGDDDETVLSTISQPSFVLWILDQLQLEKGLKVFELGAGSGWNAALMGHLVGPEGCIYSLELIPEMARTAAATVAALGIKNVKVIEADGGEGYEPGAPYDRVIFTAGAYDLPHHFFEQMKEGGLLLIVIKSEGGGDTLFLLQKVHECFESLESTPCGFVEMKGKYQLKNLKPARIESLPEWPELKHKLIGTRPFWWGGKGKEEFQWKTAGIRSFLGIIEPFFLAFKIERNNERSREKHYFGLWDQEQKSLVIAKDDLLFSYGNAAAEERLVKDIERWVKLGMPSAASFALKIYPAAFPLTADENEWIVKRQESQFLWSLNNSR